MTYNNIHAGDFAGDQSIFVRRHFLMRLSVTGRIEISFTTCAHRFFLEPYPEIRYNYYGYSAPEPLPWQ